MSARVAADVVKSNSTPSRSVAGRRLLPSVNHKAGFPLLQMKALTIGAANDRYEQEADRVADAIMRMPAPHDGLSRGDERISRKCETCLLGKEYCPGCKEDEERVQTKPQVSTISSTLQRQLEEEEEEEELMQMSSQSSANPDRVQRQPEEGEELLQAKAGARGLSRGGGTDPCHAGRGQPLPASVRAFFEPRFGHDFSNVRVHRDTSAADSAVAISAAAYTVGRHIVFGPGRYQPDCGPGRRLLAHELAHVVQQGSTSDEFESPRMKQRFTFDKNCDDAARSQISAGHRFAELMTRHAAEVLQNKPTGRLKPWFEFLFGENSEENRTHIANNFTGLHQWLSKDYTIGCPSVRDDPCDDNATEAQMLDEDKVVVCMNRAGSFSQAGMGRLLVHENVRRAKGRRNVTNINDKKTGECEFTNTGQYSEATVDDDHAVTYSCFAEKLGPQYIEAAKVKSLVGKLWKEGEGASQKSNWTGTLSIGDLDAELDVNVELDVQYVDLSYIVMGNYSYRHPKHGNVDGKIPYGTIDIVEDRDKHEALIINFEWRENGARGHGFWNSSGADKFEGRWGRGKSINNGGSWTMQHSP